MGAPLLEILSRHYGWRGALVIASAVVMNTVACGLNYREKGSTDETKPLCLKSSNAIKHSLTMYKPSDTCPTDDDETKPLCPKDDNLATQSQKSKCTDEYADQGSLSNTNCGQETYCSKERYGTQSDNDPICYINNEMLTNKDTFTHRLTSEEDQINKSGWLARYINNYQLLLQPVFICYLLSRSLSRGSGVIMYRYTPSRAVADGSSEIEASLLSSICSVMGMLGRMASTFISSSDHVNRYVFWFVTMLVNAVLSLGFSLSNNYMVNLITMSGFCLCAGEYKNKMFLLYTPQIM